MNYEELLKFVSENFHVEPVLHGNHIQTEIRCKEHGSICIFGRELRNGETVMMRSIGRHMDLESHKGYDGKPGPDLNEQDKEEMEPEEVEEAKAEGPQGEFAKRYIGLKEPEKPTEHEISEKVVNLIDNTDRAYKQKRVYQHRMNGLSWNSIANDSSIFLSHTYVSRKKRVKKAKKMYLKEVEYLQRVPPKKSSDYAEKHLYKAAYESILRLNAQLRGNLKGVLRGGGDGVVNTSHLVDLIEEDHNRRVNVAEDLGKGLEAVRKGDGG
jgi:hypothetical protein